MIVTMHSLERNSIREWFSSFKLCCTMGFVHCLFVEVKCNSLKYTFHQYNTENGIVLVLSFATIKSEVC